MKKIMCLLAILFALTSMFGAYNVGDIVRPVDNISWSITGPTGHPEVGNSSTIFDMVNTGKPVMIFFGQTW